MSNENKLEPGLRSNFAGRLLSRVMSERKKPSDELHLAAEAAKYAVEEKEEKKVATTVNI